MTINGEAFLIHWLIRNTIAGSRGRAWLIRGRPLFTEERHDQIRLELMRGESGVQKCTFFPSTISFVSQLMTSFGGRS